VITLSPILARCQSTPLARLSSNPIDLARDPGFHDLQISLIQIELKKIEEIAGSLDPALDCLSDSIAL
jgi:hypothetical protein